MKEMPRKTAGRIQGRMSSPSLDGPTYQRYQARQNHPPESGRWAQTGRSVSSSRPRRDDTSIALSCPQNRTARRVGSTMIWKINHLVETG
jgi:hypothetical protein